MLRDEAIPAAIEAGTWAGELHLVRSDGREFPVSLVLIANRSADGDVAFISAIGRDLTEHKALEQRLHQARTMEAIGRLAGGIAHDFNNLLTSIIGHSDLLLRHLEDDQTRTDAEEIKAAGQRAAALTNQLLAFSRRQVLQPRPLDLNTLIADLSEHLTEMAGDRIELAMQLDTSLGRVKADPVQLQEIIVSLVENACDAMPDGGRLTICTAHFDVGLTPDAVRHLDFLEPGPYAVLSVIDSGCGMDEETLTRIFEPFFSTKKEVKGIGLGLPTVYGIIKQSGGDIWVESAPGQGTTVKVYLPAVEQELDAGPEAQSVDESRTDTRTILLAEDEPAVLKLAARVLRSRGYNVLQARDGVEALEIQQAHPGHIDVLITDVIMPRLGGAELAERLLGSRPDTRVIYISGYTDNKTVRDMMANKDMAFLRKPFTPQALLQLARRVLNEEQRRTA
jgi:signal transduction histidine kinase/ActR/RegA family two-component response regulator